jgi:hypothetical protein
MRLDYAEQAEVMEDRRSPKYSPPGGHDWHPAIHPHI